MRLVIADTSPLNYLLLIGHIDILPALFDRVILPAAVMNELKHPGAPVAVQSWIAALPAWVEMRNTASGHVHDAALAGLGAGEEDAIVLAVELHADLLLMDDDRGVTVARSKGLEVTGTMGLLGRAARRQLLNLVDAFDRLKRTNFRYRQEIMDELLRETGGPSTKQ